MTANLNLMTKHLSPILLLMHTASRTSAIWFEPLFKACGFLFGTRVTFWVISILRRNGSPAILILWFFEPPCPTGKTSRLLCSLEVKTRPNCLGRSKNPSAERPEGTSLVSYQSLWNYLSPLDSWILASLENNLPFYSIAGFTMLTERKVSTQ